MKREVVEDFLNLPGIAGIALIDRRSRPYFCGVDNTLNFQQKEALAQGLRQVVETTPEGFESFEFQFAQNQVFIYKLPEGMILLVLTTLDLVYSHYADALNHLKAELIADSATAIATVRLLAGSLTLSNQTYWKDSPSPSPSPTPVPLTSYPRVPPVPPTPEAASQVTLKELLEALNQLSLYTTQYLGKAVITNYWKSTRPDGEWLQSFEISRTAELTFTRSTALTQTVTPEQLSWIQSWVQAFISRCIKVIRDFPALVEKSLKPEYKQLLLP
ncbi:hypothetical protein PMG71_02800 [Roseofilum sp. BLCC_M154]|uniref:Roadblock/LAMTOR2 domain-containing protein n=1 Tax=Roseofilum acuticapitatum BLCC-M154 TaxID=3022444 RepID=A0ABT7AN88_9CYAN|nr:hypothetical protein [Roseofilum acuticapitatum]MDJ1168350.1 hypothetical protein [Roseofilum acuticapitatum BLCC-M154]